MITYLIVLLVLVAAVSIGWGFRFNKLKLELDNIKKDTKDIFLTEAGYAIEYIDENGNIAYYKDPKYGELMLFETVATAKRVMTMKKINGSVYLVKSSLSKVDLDPVFTREVKETK